jgi:hypothetical protein
MWECLGCSYHNDDWDEACQRCGVERISASAPEPSASAQAQAGDATQVAQVQAPALGAAGAAPQDAIVPAAVPAPATISSTTSQPHPRRSRTADVLLVAVILLCLGGLGAVGYLAWQRGLLDAYLPGAASGVAPANGAAVAGQAPADDAAVLSEQDILEDPLDRVEQGRAPGLGRLKPYAKILREARQTLAGTTFKSSEPGVLAPEAQQLLAATGAMGEGLLSAYQEFEGKAARIKSERTEEYKKLLRDEFLARFIELLDAIGQAYALDKTGQNSAYMLSDNVPRVVEQYQQLDPAPLHEHWQKALHAREQLFLDMQNYDIYRQLAARYQALLEVHNEFNKAMDAIPPYRTRAGTLDKNGEQALTLYDSLATKVEEAALEFQEYSAQLDPNTTSDKRKELLKAFLDLAQADHFTCFLETYKIYAMDHNLTHDAYTNLIEVHYPFVKTNWPEREPDYRATSYKYEEEWKQRWHKE